MNELAEAKKVEKNYEFNFQCKNCGDCCRNVKNGVMVESFDFYRIVNLLGENAVNIFDKYTEIVFLTESYPILTMKTKLHLDTCVFLRNGKCSIYAARPRACRLYPLSLDPDINDFTSYNACIFPTRKQHFVGKSYRVSDWMDENYTLEDREFIKYDVLSVLEIAKLISKIDRKYENEIVKLILYYKYLNYDFSKEFLPQFKLNMAILKEQLEKNRLKEIFGGMKDE